MAAAPARPSPWRICMSPCRQGPPEGGGMATRARQGRLAGGEFGGPDLLPANPIPVCSPVNNYDARRAVDEPRFACGWTPGAVARIPQITSLDPGRPRGNPKGMRPAAARRTSAYRPAACVSSYLDLERQGRDGMSLLEGIIDSRNNPLAVVEDIAANNNWPFERSGEDEVTIVSKGNWTDYQLSFTWMTGIEALHLACAFDMKIPVPRRAEVQRLIASVNEQLWVGHFDIWTHTGMIMYRQALVLPGGMTASTAQCETMLAA